MFLLQRTLPSLLATRAKLGSPLCITQLGPAGPAKRGGTRLPHALAESGSVCDVGPERAGWRGVEDKAGGGRPCCYGGDILSRDTELAPGQGPWGSNTCWGEGASQELRKDQTTRLQNRHSRLCKKGSAGSEGEACYSGSPTQNPASGHVLRGAREMLFLAIG